MNTREKLDKYNQLSRPSTSSSPQTITGENPFQAAGVYKCPWCPFAFDNEASLAAHKFSHDYTVKDKIKDQKRKCILDNYVNYYESESDDDNEENINGLENKVKKEVEYYLAYRVERKVLQSEEDSFDILSWWKKHEDFFPWLIKTVKYYLCIPATSATSERAFSSSNDIVTKKRNRFAPELVNKLCYLKNNFRNIPK